MKRFLILTLATLGIASATLPQSAEAQDGYGSSYGYGSNGYRSNYGYGSAYGQGLGHRPLDSYNPQKDYDWRYQNWGQQSRNSNSGFGYRRGFGHTTPLSEAFGGNSNSGFGYRRGPGAFDDHCTPHTSDRFRQSGYSEYGW